MAKILCVLYDRSRRWISQSLSARRPSDARPAIPAARPCRRRRPSISNRALCWAAFPASWGCGNFSKRQGHTLVVTSDKDGPNSDFEQELPDADIVISQPFWPAYLTAERIAKAPKLKLAITAGIGSDHVDLQAAIERGITVAEVTYCNSISVAEHVVMMILGLVRNYLPSYRVGGQEGLEYRRLRGPLLRSGRHGGRHRRRRPHRPGRSAAAQAFRRQAALHRPAPPAGGGREGAGSDLPSQRRVDGAGLRCGHDQLPRCTRRPSTCSTTR